MLGEQVARDERHNRSVGTVLLRGKLEELEGGELVRVAHLVRVRVRVGVRVRG